METVANWGVRPVFITSTFQDMKAERNWLWDIVAPAIEAELRRYRRHLEWIDLRLGADATPTETEAEREALVLKVCLDEVRRSRPFLVALIGDRYGWIPPQDRAKAAAREANITGDVAGRSVTDLEIDFGVFHDPEQRRRSLFFLRGPLPYADMGELAARYSDEYRTDSDAPKCVDGLKALKQRISGSFEDHVFRYTAAWDVATQQVNGLEAFGEQVTAAILAQLRVDLAEEAAPAELTWQQQEASALDEFAADRRRDFQARAALLNDIADFLTAPTQPDTIWARCLSGTAGSGKSSVFSEILARLHAIQAAAKPRDSALNASARQADDAMREWVDKLATHNPPFAALQGRLHAEPVLVLAHAAAASPRAPSVDAMLRRWISELAAFLGVPDGLADNADADTVETTFASLLGRAAQRRRVVVLIDALDQLEQTPRGRFLTWLPKLWPDNARLFATAIAGDASKALAQRQPGSDRTLDKLSREEAREVYLAIHRRYHRNADEELCAVLLGRPEEAWSNPLWLYLAVEQLNLLDGDDVAEAEHGDPTLLPQRLRAMLRERAMGFPPDLQGLYRVTFDHAARWFPKMAPWFLGLIAVGAGGWRESDFRAVLPELSGVSWDDLHFAYLRRLFRGQIRPRGALGQWDVAHAQMRKAMREWLAEPSAAKLVGRNIEEKKLQAALAEHLLRLPVEDPLRASETMRHLLGAEELRRAAEYYGDPELPDAARAGATKLLAEAWLADQAELPVRAQLSAMLDVATCSSVIVGLLARRMLFDLHDEIGFTGSIKDTQEFIEIPRSALQALISENPYNEGWRYDLSVSFVKTGTKLASEGKLAQSVNIFQEGIKEIEYCINKNPEKGVLLHCKCNLCRLIGEIFLAQKKIEPAQNAFRSNFETATLLVKLQPDNYEYQYVLAQANEKIGELLHSKGDLEGALASWQASLAINSEIASAGVEGFASDMSLSVCFVNIGDILLEQGNVEAAESLFRDSLKTREALYKKDPENRDLKRAFSISLGRVGNSCLNRNNHAEALEYFEFALRIDNELSNSDPDNLEWLSDSSVSYNQVGAILLALGRHVDALAAFRAGFIIRDRLVKADSGNANWQRALIFSCGQIAKLVPHEARGLLGRAYQIALALQVSGRLEPRDSQLVESISRRLSALPQEVSVRSASLASGDRLLHARAHLAANDAAGAAALLADAPSSPGLPNARAVCALRLGDPRRAIDLLRPVILPDGASSPPDATPDAWIVTYAAALALCGELPKAGRALEWLKNADQPGAAKLRNALAAWHKSLSWKEATRYRLGGGLPRSFTLHYQPGELW